MHRSAWAAGVALAALTGCGPAKPVAASGAATLGAGPLTNASILFEPADPANGTTGTAVVGPDGRFSASCSAGPGLRPGNYRVAVVADDAAPPPAAAPDVEINSPEYLKLMEAAAKKAPEPVKKPRVPLRYGNPGGSGLGVTVAPGGSTDLQLKLAAE